MKQCSKCGEPKDESEFYRNKLSKDALCSRCKICSSKYIKEYYSTNSEYIKENIKKYRLANSEYIREVKKKYNLARSEANKNWRIANPRHVKKNAKKYCFAHPERVKQTHKNWEIAHPETMRAIAKRRNAKRRSTPKGKLNSAMAGGIWCSLKGAKFGRHWETLVGYILNDLKAHLEKRFKEGMNWKNYGRNGWHVDHKIPISVFNFTKPGDIDFKKCWALSNLQPLWAKENIIKKDKLDKPFQPSLLLKVN